MSAAQYDQLGRGYAVTRRPDPRIAARIEEGRRSGRERLVADLESGAWDERFGHLREAEELEVGLRLVVVSGI